MYPLHEDMHLSEAQQRLVLDYIQEVEFAIPGTTPTDYEVVPLARYVGWNFIAEDLEAYAVGLRCTKPGYERYHTFIRMSFGQLMAHAEAQRLPVNPPILANEGLRLQRYRDHEAGPTRTGVDAYATDDGSVPGVDMDLAQLEGVLDDIERYSAGHRETEFQCAFDLALELGTLLAGRYPRLVHFTERLRDDQLHRLRAFEARMGEMEPVLTELELPTLTMLTTPERRAYQQHHG